MKNVIEIDANYRKLKVGNCTLKNTNFEFCSYH